MELRCYGTWGGRPVPLSWARVWEVAERLERVVDRSSVPGECVPLLPDGTPVCYGGETSCLEVRYRPDRRLFLDAGSGFRAVRPEVAGETVDVFLTHLHLDHTVGLILNPALWRGELTLVVHAVVEPGSTLRGLLEELFRPPLWPVSLAMLGDRIRYVEHICVDPDWSPTSVKAETVHVAAMPVAHTNLAVAWRIDYAGKTVVFAADREAAKCDGPRFSRFAAEADVLVHDAQYTPEEYREHVGWGHSAYTDAVDAALAAGARTLWLWHHRPDRSYALVDRIGEAARQYARQRAREAGRKEPAVVIPYDGLHARL